MAPTTAAKTRILFVFPQWHFNINDLLNALRKNMHVATAHLADSDEVQQVGTVGLPGIDMHTIRLWKKWHISRSEFFIPRFTDLFRAIDKADYVILKNLYDPQTLFGLAYTTVKRKPVAITEQGVREDHRGITAISFFLIKHLYVQPILRLRNIPVFAVTQNAYKQAPTYTKTRAYVPFAIEHKTKQATVGASPKTIRILNVGKFQHRKQQHVTIAAINELQQKYPDIRFQLTLIGGIAKERSYREQINQLIADSPANIIIKEKVAQNKMGAEYCSADIFIMASYDEQAAYSVLEAMAYGVPVISSTGNGTACYLTPETGAVFTVRSVASLAKTIERISIRNNKIQWKTLKRMGAQARRAAQTIHDPDRIAQRIQTLLQRRYGRE